MDKSKLDQLNKIIAQKEEKLKNLKILLCMRIFAFMLIAATIFFSWWWFNWKLAVIISLLAWYSEINTKIVSEHKNIGQSWKK